jgi:ribose transport system ATP-binding protein
LLVEDRKNEGLILDFDINQNISLTNLNSITRPLGISHKTEAENNQKLIEQVNVKTPSLNQKVKNLSGGNQQKVVICKWINADVDILIFDEPTRGIDVGAKAEIYKLMNKLKQENKAVIMVSSELSECMGISDCIYVMHEGSITGFITPDTVREVTEKEIIIHATGQSKTRRNESDEKIEV